MTQDDAFSRALAFTHALEDRIATRVEHVGCGRALLAPAFPEVWDFNFLRVERPERVRDAGALVDDAARALGAAGCEHLQIRISDAELAARLAPGLVLRGLTAMRHAYLARRRPPDRTVDTTSVREVDEATLREARERAVRAELPDRGDDVVRQLVDLHDVVARATDMARLAVYAGSEIVAYCSLYSDGRVAQIEEVMTLPEHRGRGHGRALLTAAIRAASAHSLVFLVADEDDWPLALYERLGFELVGRVYVFNAAPARARPTPP